MRVHTKKPIEEAYKQCTCKYCIELKKQEVKKMETLTKIKLMKTASMVLLSIGLLMIYFANNVIGMGILAICSAFLIHKVIEMNY